jgi:hypothetical protein
MGTKLSSETASAKPRGSLPTGWDRHNARIRSSIFEGNLTASLSVSFQSELRYIPVSCCRKLAACLRSSDHLGRVGARGMWLTWVC